MRTGARGHRSTEVQTFVSSTKSTREKACFVILTKRASKPGLINVIKIHAIEVGSKTRLVCHNSS